MAKDKISTAKVVEIEEDIEPILVKHMQLLQFVHQTHVCTTRSKRTVEQLENSKTWAFASTKLQMHDRVEIMDAQASQLSKGIVTYIKGTDVHVHIYANYVLKAESQDEIPYRDYLIRWGGVHDKWIIVGKTDGAILKAEFPTDIAAINYLKDHYKALSL